MNESRYKFFLLYMIDLHNLHIEDRVDLIANPLNEKRNGAIVENVVVSPKESNNVTVESAVDDLVMSMKKDLNIANNIEEKFEDFFTEDDGGLKCYLCPGSYKREGHLRNHLESKHKKTFKLICSCGKVFPDSTRLQRHRKTCQ